MEDRIRTLEQDMTKLDRRVTSVEVHLQNGNNSFNRVEAAIGSLSDDLKEHMEQETGKLFAVASTIIIGLVSIVGGLLVYIWANHG